LKTGFQKTPVLSSAMCVTPSVSSQSDNASRSAVIVVKVRTCLRTRPSSSVIRTHTTTVRLWTSSPQHRAYTTCIASLPRCHRPAEWWAAMGAWERQLSSTCSPPRGRRQSGILDAPGSACLSGSRHRTVVDLDARPTTGSVPPIFINGYVLTDIVLA
jgi:hypothetical protein